MWILIGVVLLLAPLAACYSGIVPRRDAVSDRDRYPKEEVARDAGRNFLMTYVDDEGRVVRRDEGGDVVSEGQAYGMLIAAAIGEERAFREVWSWAKTNLARPDGLLAWRWQRGSITDSNSASDADLDAARALVLAGNRFHAPNFTTDGERLAEAVLDRETVPVSPGPSGTVAAPADGVILVGGSWATTAPQQINPSYFNPRGERDMLKLTSDPRWTALASTHRAIVERLLSSAALPPDWVQLEGDSVSPTGHESAPIQFGLDAARIPIRLAESCSAEDRRLAAGMRVTLDRPMPPPGIRHLDGGPATDWKHPVALVAAAATDHAAGDDAAADERLDAAADLNRHYPSYYGAAWVAMGHIMLQTSLLGNCDD